jgi:hypothetical protein
VDNEDGKLASIKVSAHVLVQLGEELVTDAEQAILECVKNAYDADAPGCVVTVRTNNSGVITQEDDSDRLAKFSKATDTVKVDFFDSSNSPINPDKNAKRSGRIKRNLNWTGSIVIEDNGDGISEEKIRTSWLVISGSVKRPKSGIKEKTIKGRTPLGDKGVGRLGTMKLGDVLLVESATAPNEPLSSALFRWADCDVAATVDEIPVQIDSSQNPEGFKGTRVSILGLRDIEQWKGAKRALEITRSLATLISPFEVKSKFPVTVDVDGHKSSLVAVTNALLSRAIAEFHFSWTRNDLGKAFLKCNALFHERLFRSEGGTAAQQWKSEAVFGKDEGKDFLEWLKTNKRLSMFKITGRPTQNWFVEVEQEFDWLQIKPTNSEELPSADPGPFTGAIYYFHLTGLSNSKEDEPSDDQDQAEPDKAAAAGIGIDRSMIKEMAGISILRDGFRVRSPGDWLKISEGMTTGSTYNLRYHNTLGYFSLSGEHNHSLVE